MHAVFSCVSDKLFFLDRRTAEDKLKDELEAERQENQILWHLQVGFYYRYTYRYVGRRYAGDDYFRRCDLRALGRIDRRQCVGFTLTDARAPRRRF